MKKSSFLALAVAPMIVGAPLASLAQDSVATDPVGFVKSPLNDGSYTLVGVNLTKASVYGAMVESSTSDSITASDSEADIAALLDAGTYYVEITGGDLEGDRIDIASASGNEITLDTAAAHNTLSDASAIPADSTFVIRAHYTFADVGEDIGTDSLAAGSSETDADQILTYDGGFQIYFYASDENWYTTDGNFTEVNDNVIAPGSGVLFYANPAGGERDLELTALGSVRNNDFTRPLDAGYQIVSTGFPMDLSPGELMMTTEFFTGGSGDTDADQILTYDGGFQIHFLGTDDNWYTTDGNFTDVTDEDFFSAQGAMLVFLNSADPDFRVANQLE